MQVISQLCTPANLLLVGALTCHTTFVADIASRKLRDEHLKLPGSNFKVVMSVLLLAPALMGYGLLRHCTVPRLLALSIAGAPAAIYISALEVKRCAEADSTTEEIACNFCFVIGLSGLLIASVSGMATGARLGGGTVIGMRSGACAGLVGSLGLTAAWLSTV